MLVCIQLHMNTCAHVCGGWRLSLGLVPQDTIHLGLVMPGLSLVRRQPIWLSCLVSKSQGSTCLQLLRAGNIDSCQYPGWHVGIGYQNQFLMLLQEVFLYLTHLHIPNCCSFPTSSLESHSGSVLSALLLATFGSPPHPFSFSPSLSLLTPLISPNGKMT